MADGVNLAPIVRAIDRMGGELTREINSVSRQVDGVGVELGQVRNDLRLTSDELRELKAAFQEYVDEAARVAAVQRSETKVGNLRAELDRQYGHYSVVRRTSVGILQAFDVGAVSNDTVTSVSEELMLQTPRYWLAPALVAIAAWSRDDSELAEKGVQEAFSRDRYKTSLFFTLVLRRQGRQESAVRWLRHYLSSLDPTALTREFAVVLEAASYQAFGGAGQKVMAEAMATWCRELRSREDIVEAQIRNWVGEIGVQRLKVDASQYPTLSKISPEWPKLERQIERASATDQVRAKYEAVRDVDVQMPSMLEDALDDLLDQLVTEYDDEELPLRREVVYHDAVIEEGGDIQRAQARADEISKALEETSDVVSLQTSAAIQPEHLGVSVQTQRVAIGVGVSDFRAAVSRYCVAYRRDAVDRMTFSFASDHSNYASTYGFPGLTVSSDEAEDAVIAKITSTWQTTFDRYIQSIMFNNKWYTTPVLIAVAVAVVCFFINPIVGVLALIGGGGLVYFLGEQKKRQCADEVAKAEKTRAQAIETTMGIYRDANAELVDANLAYAELDGHEEALLQLIDTWPTASAEEKVA